MSTGSPDQPGSAEPGLDHLFRALTADGHPHELAGRDAALAMFRGAVQTPRRHGLPRTWLPGSVTARVRRSRFTLPSRLVTMAVAGTLAVAGVTAAAYAQVLPAPVQQIAYSVLAPLGVPGNPPQPTRPEQGPVGHPGAPGPAATSPAPSGTPAPTASSP